jgi:membrane protease YdiL (CAAX protease family)
MALSDESVQAMSGWARFWNRGTWWKAVILVVAYAVVYQLLGLLTSTLFGDLVDAENLFGSVSSIFLGLALPILLGGVLLLLFGWSIGAVPRVFGRQPIAGRGWMWLAVLLVLIPIVLRLLATDWSAYTVAIVLTVLFAGLCVGFAEELLTRGYVVNLLRSAGHTERVVMVISSALFALLHSTNVFTGQSLVTVAITVVYTFGFGAMMYLSMRVTGSVVWAILLHAATDQTTILATGGIDAHGDAAGAEGLISIAGIFNWLYILFALIAIFIVKGRVKDTRPATEV